MKLNGTIVNNFLTFFLRYEKKNKKKTTSRLHYCMTIVQLEPVNTVNLCMR